MVWGDLFGFFPHLFSAIVDFCRSFYELLFTEIDAGILGQVTLFDFIFYATVGLLVYRIVANIIFP